MWVALACALFLAQTLPLFEHRWVEDESWQSIPAHALITEGRIRNPTFADTDEEFAVTVKPPAHTLVLAPLFKFFGVGVWQARLPSLLAGLGVVVLTFLLGRKLLNPTAGVVAALLVATDNFLFLGARTARPDVFVTLCAAAAAVLAMQSRPLGSGLLVGAAMMFHPNGVASAVATGGLLAMQSGRQFWRDKRLWTFLAAVALIVAVFLAWSHSSPVHSEAFARTYGRAENVPLLTKLRSEPFRYADFLGFGNVRLNIALPVPARAHIAALALAAFGVLAWKDRSSFAVLVLLTAPYLLWWLYLINKTSRYFAIIAPFVAVALAAAVSVLMSRRKCKLAALGAAALIGLSQLAGNVFLLLQSRPADYPALQRQLRQLIPPGATVYGAITFWAALHDRAYSSYERTPLAYAIANRRPRYLILNDRVMVKGMGWGLDDWAELREAANAFARAHGELLGRVSSAFYGELEIWRVNYPRQ
jgi:4-amino-4-deoxy-L-arabinose transferase-like glycosyltransferase